jgi:hypothetical protein
MSASDRNASTAQRVGIGALVGAGAYALGYLLTYVAVADTIRSSPVTQILELLTRNSPVWKLVGWTYYGGHFVDAIVPGLFGGSNAVNLVAADPITDAVYLFAPLVLVLAGVVVAHVAGATTPTAGAKAGVAVVAGYLPLAVAGVFVFTIRIEDVTAAPDLAPAVLLAGILYPLVFGAVGGALRGATG